MLVHKKKAACNGCWIHCRRYFIAGFSIEERKEKRQKEAYPVIKDLETWLYTKVGIYPEKSPMTKAMSYALTHMPKLARYVNDGLFGPDNNDIEEVIRPLKVGLNNYGYCHNHDAAYRDTMIYSFIATCNKADVNPREWMVHHTTEAEHVTAILKSRAKRKESEEEASKGESK